MGQNSEVMGPGSALAAGLGEHRQTEPVWD
jgi:hypothetical protein